MAFDRADEIVEALSTCSEDELPSVLAALTARYQYDDVAEFAEKAKKLVFPKHEGPVRTIAMFYFRMNNGGIEHELALLANLLSSMGYRVVVIVDEMSPEDYPLDDGVEKVRLLFPRGVSREEEKLGRFEDLLRIVRTYQIDLFINHGWMTPDLVFDVILCRLCGVRCVFNAHGVFGSLLVSMYYEKWVFNSIPRTLRYYESVVTQTAISAEFFGKFCPHTHVILNCVDSEGNSRFVRKGALDADKPTILWLGRFEESKRPEDAVDILACLRNEQGIDATLLFVGKSEDGAYEVELTRIAENLGVADHVKFAGYRTDVETFYAMADVLLMTTEHEGFCMVLLEASAAGLPTVMYRLPYLPFDSSEGIAKVAIGDREDAAAEIADIVNNPELWEHMSKGARACYDRFLAYDYEGAWRAVIDEPSDEPDAQPSEMEQFMWDILLQHFAIGRSRTQNCRDRDVEQAREQGRAEVRAEYEQSFSYKLGRALTLIPRKLREKHG